MESENDKRDSRACSICLVTATFTFHVLALLGHIEVAGSMDALALSTDGWSNVGLGLAKSMVTDLDRRMDQVSHGLTDAVEVLSSMEAKVDQISAWADALPQPNASVKPSLVEVPADNNTASIEHAKRELRLELSAFLEAMKIVVKQVRRWMVSFGDRLVKSMLVFSEAMDVAQKVLDQVMSKISAGGENADEMKFQTFSLFDVSNTGKISAADMRNVSALYTITALREGKVDQLFTKYDIDGDRFLDVAEYGAMVDDDSIPGVMAIVLRRYARQLAAIAGELESATMKDEVASAVSEYLAIVCAKNATKGSWAAQALSNGSLPLSFTAGVLAQLAIDVDNPNQRATADVGSFLVDRMFAEAPDNVTSALSLLVNASFWEAEGLDADRQPAVVDRVSGWVEEARVPRGQAAALLQQFVEKAGKGGHQDVRETKRTLLPDTEHEADEDVGVFMQCHSELARSSQISEEEDEVALLQRAARQKEHALLPSNDASDSDAAPAVPAWLLETRRCVARSRRTSAAVRSARMVSRQGSGARAPGEVVAVQSRVEPSKETIQFARWLAANASAVAHMRLRESFEYSARSSDAMESVARMMSKMVNRFSDFLNVFQQFTSERSFDRLEGFIGSLQEALDDPSVRMSNFSALSEIETNGPTTSSGSVGPAHGNSTQLAQEMLFRAWVKAEPVVTRLRSVIPGAVAEIKRARKEVASAASVLNFTFSIFKEKGPPLFNLSARFYRQAWIAYFVIFALLTLGILFFALYETTVRSRRRPPQEDASGRSASSRMMLCLTEGCGCFRFCDDSLLFFWSVLIFVEILWLIMFIVSGVLLVVAGVRVFVSSGCQQVYILGDWTVCNEAMIVVGKLFDNAKWFSSGDGPSSVDSLLVCKVISSKMGTAIWVSALSTLVAALLTFNLLVDSALLHERRRLEKEQDSA